MEEYLTRSEYNKKYYEKNNPFPIRLGELKMKLKMEAFEKGVPMTDVVREILNNHFDKGKVEFGS